MVFPVGGVHIGDISFGNLIYYNKVGQGLSDYDMGYDGHRHYIQGLWLRHDTLACKTKLFTGLYQSFHCCAFLVCEGVLPDAGDGYPQSI